MHTHRSLLSSSLFIEIAKTAGGRKAMLLNMLEKMRIVVSTPPDIFLHPNTPPAGLFVIDEGDCAVYDRGKRCFELGKGDFFGEELLTGEVCMHRPTWPHGTCRHAALFPCAEGPTPPA